MGPFPWQNNINENIKGFYNILDKFWTPLLYNEFNIGTNFPNKYTRTRLEPLGIRFILKTKSDDRTGNCYVNIPNTMESWKKKSYDDNNKEFIVVFDKETQKYIFCIKYVTNYWNTVAFFNMQY